MPPYYRVYSGVTLFWEKEGGMRRREDLFLPPGCVTVFNLSRNSCFMRNVGLAGGNNHPENKPFLKGNRQVKHKKPGTESTVAQGMSECAKVYSRV